MQESRVKVEVSANGGADYTNNQKFFLYHAAITIEQLVPSRGFAMTGNQAVTILGYNFAEAADLVCTFGLNDTVIGARLSPEKVRCSVPEREAGRVRVTVSYSHGSSGQLSSALYIYEPKLSLSQVYPSRGPTAGGTLVTFSVTPDRLDLVGKIKCIFDQQEVYGVRTGASTAVCRTPKVASPLLTKVVALIQDDRLLTTADGVQFRFYKRPGIDLLLPSAGPSSGGTLVSVKGSEFVPDGLKCMFGPTVLGTSDARWISSSIVECVSPSSSGVLNPTVELSFNGGVDYTNEGHEFNYQKQVVISAIRPSILKSDVEGQVVTVSGQNFATDARLSCMFGDKAARARFLTSTLISCIVPKQRAGAMAVAVSSNGVDTSESGALIEFAGSDLKLSVAPSMGPAHGGTMVNVSLVATGTSAWDCSSDSGQSHRQKS